MAASANGVCRTLVCRAPVRRAPVCHSPVCHAPFAVRRCGVWRCLLCGVWECYPARGHGVWCGLCRWGPRAVAPWVLRRDHKVAIAVVRWTAGWAVPVTSVVWCQASVRGVTPGRGVTPVGASVELSAHLSIIAFAFQMGQPRLAARIVSPRRAAARQLLTVRTVAENSTVEQCKLAVEPFWGLQGQGTRYHERNIED